jgi:hypothetical protein
VCAADRVVVVAVVGLALVVVEVLVVHLVVSVQRSETFALAITTLSVGVAILPRLPISEIRHWLKVLHHIEVAGCAVG